MNETEIRTQVLALCEALDNKKAFDILALNVADKTIIADWFIIASGRSTTQVKALCDELEEKAAERGLIAQRKEGYQEAAGSSWISERSLCTSSIRKSASITSWSGSGRMIRSIASIIPRSMRNKRFCIETGADYYG